MKRNECKQFVNMERKIVFLDKKRHYYYEGRIITETANYTLVFRRAASGAPCQLELQTSNTNSDKLMFVGGAIT